MPPREPTVVRPPACKILGIPALSNVNSPPQLIALSTSYLWQWCRNQGGSGGWRRPKIWQENFTLHGVHYLGLVYLATCNSIIYQQKLNFARRSTIAGSSKPNVMLW